MKELSGGIINHYNHIICTLILSKFESRSFQGERGGSAYLLLLFLLPPPPHLPRCPPHAVVWLYVGGGWLGFGAVPCVQPQPIPGAPGHRFAICPLCPFAARNPRFCWRENCFPLPRPPVTFGPWRTPAPSLVPARECVQGADLSVSVLPPTHP